MDSLEAVDLDFESPVSVNPSVAVCIPTYNQSDHLEKTIESLLSQTLRPQEIWISDDASTDGTADYVANLPVIMADASIRLFVVRQERNLGMVANTDYVMRRPSTDFIVKLDSDDLLQPRFIELLRDGLVANPGAGFAHAAVQEIDGAGALRRARRLYRPSGYQDSARSVRGAIRGYRVAANICMFRRTALEAARFYRLDLRFGEDWDLSFRIAAAGFGNVYIGEILASYRVWDDPGGFRVARKRDELDAIRSIFDVVIIPYASRHPHLLPEVNAARRRFALRQSACLANESLDVAARSELRRLVLQLDASRATRLMVFLWQSPAAFVFLFMADLRLRARDELKSVIYRLTEGASRKPERVL
jgi:glycosyltransferase involved in cell wall biosynthesis